MAQPGVMVTVCNNSHHTLDILLHYLVQYNNSKLTQIHTKYNKMSSYFSLTQLEMLPVQRVTNVVTEFVQNVPSCPHAGSKSYAPLINCALNNTVACRAKMLLQLIHIVNALLIDRLLNDAPNFVVNWV